MRNPLVEAALGAKLEFRNIVSQIWRILHSFVRPATTGNAEEETARAFCFLNLLLFVSLILLSPDKVVQVLPPVQSVNEMVGRLQDAFEMLRKLTPL